MKKEIVIDMSEIETRAALLEEGKVVEFFFDRATQSRLVGNIFKGVVENVLPGIQSAFVNIGLDKNAFLFVGDMLLDDKNKAQKVEELVRSGEEIVVQVTKEPMGTKGARISTKISLPGRYVVLMPGIDTVGISHRIGSVEERERLKKALERLRPVDVGIIARTAAEGVSPEKLKEDIDSLLRLWDRILKKLKLCLRPVLFMKKPVSSILWFGMCWMKKWRVSGLILFWLPEDKGLCGFHRSLFEQPG